MSIFYPASIDFVKSRAKQLHRTFPALSLSTCQTATARALGFKDWFDASKRIGSANITLSKPDEEVAHVDHLQRRYQQSRALVDTTNLPSLEVDSFVRAWNLTSAAPAALSEYITSYDQVNADLCSFERGEMTQDELEELYDYESPERVADGIILARSGHKYTYYHLSLERLLAMPLYLRGTPSIFLDFEDGNYVKLAFPDLFPEEELQEALDYLEQNDPLRYEWHTGRKARDYDGITLKQMLEEAQQHPDDWFALSLRWPNENINKEYVIPALAGSDFVRFIEAKGSLNGLELQWFKPKNPDLAFRLSRSRFSQELTGRVPTIRMHQQDIVPTAPLYGSPFKRAPMSDMEYDQMVESGALMLSVELDEDDDDDGDMSTIDDLVLSK